MEQIGHQGCADFLIIQKIGHVVTDHVSANSEFPQTDILAWIVEDPAKRASPLPSAQPGSGPFGVRVIKKSSKRTDRALFHGQIGKSVNCSGDISQFGDR